MKNRVDNIDSVELNVTELCNRKCWFCPRSDPKVYRNQDKHMTIETFQHVSDALLKSNYKGRIHISGFSEPIYCKYLFEGLEILTKNFNVNMITNGDRLTVDILKKLDTFNLNRIKIDLYDGEHQLEKINKLLKDSNYSNYVFINKVYEKENDKLGFYNRAGTSKFESNVGKNLDRSCFVPFHKVMIDWTGNYLLCMSDWHRESDISKSGYNVKNLTLEEYLNSNLFNQFRKVMKESKRRNLLPCNGCDIDGQAAGKFW